MNETVKSYISHFRIRELQSVLEQLGLPKSGRKSDLVARVFAFFGEDPPNGIRCRLGHSMAWGGPAHMTPNAASRHEAAVFWRHAEV